MDVVTDLTARAVSYVSVYRDICKRCGLDPELDEKHIDRNVSEVKAIVSGQPFIRPISNPDKLIEDIDKLLTDLIWKGSTKDNIPILDDMGQSMHTLLQLFEVEAQTYLDLHPPKPIQDKNDLYASPYFWRQCFRAALYRVPENNEPGNRCVIAGALEYVPIQVVLALGGKKEEAYMQRLLQVYGRGIDRLGEVPNLKWWQIWDKIINQRGLHKSWWDAGYITKREKRRDELGFKKIPSSEVGCGARRAQIERLLKNNSELLALLKFKEIPLPFESFYNLELDEINTSREKRRADAGDGELWPYPPLPAEDKDPLIRANNMKLAGLALSGGGIRSATFNLGVMQKLAELGVLQRFDYLSTVSGGGYIGSWLTSWLFHSGNLAKVRHRMNPKLSADPMGEEVRPIRWLRMYSNYLSPKSGIMSGDAWTVGMTWIRNTLINQIILLLLLCTTLSGVAFIYQSWRAVQPEKNVNEMQPYSPNLWMVGIVSFLILIVGAAIVGMGMRVFDRNDSPPGRYQLGKSRWLPIILIIWAALTGFFGSAWLNAHIDPNATLLDYLAFIWPVGVAGFIAMLFLAGIGRYHARSNPGKQKRLLWTSVFITSAIAAVAGSLLLAAISKLLMMIAENPAFVNEKLTGQPRTIEILCRQFIVGVPLVLETLSICVVLRMALMGNLFPEERREWWGRVGAIVHRFIAIWLLISVAALILPKVILELIPAISTNKDLLPAAIATWGAAIGTAVKLAFQSKSATEKAGGVNYVGLFVKFAPYLFMVGFLMIGSAAFEAISDALRPPFKEWMDCITSIPWLLKWKTGGGAISAFINLNGTKFLFFLVLTIVLGGITFAISWRVGVNEFSLHHFYRNRLTRAYLGATRRRTDRDNTANRFTGFDEKDDILLKNLVFKEKGFSGPYPIINTAINATTVSALDRQDRKAESFIFSPLFCGFDFSTNRSAADSRNGIFQYGYRNTDEYAELNGPTLGTAMSVSGAAVSPNMGYHSSAPTAFLLTVFNVRLGRWIGNPRLNSWRRSDPKAGLGYLVKDMIGKSDIENDYVYLSDGGHFDNMGLYELIRRKCTYILLCDAEEDTEASCEGLANAIRRCRIDFGVEINLETKEITHKNESNGFGEKHLVRGTISYPGDLTPTGTIIYIKTALTGNEGTDIRQYYLANKSFPQQSTGDQFFDEAQFESYRQLGYYSIEAAKNVPVDEKDPTKGEFLSLV